MASTKIFVGSLPPNTKPEELRHLFENYGIVIECDIMNRCGFVHMKNMVMAENAIVALNATDFKGQTIVVEPGRPKESKNSNDHLPKRNAPTNYGRGGRGGYMNFSRDREGRFVMKEGAFPNGVFGDRSSWGSGHESFRSIDDAVTRPFNNNNIGPVRTNYYKSNRPTPYSEPMYSSNNNNDSYEERNDNYNDSLRRGVRNSGTPNDYRGNYYVSKPSAQNFNSYELQQNRNNNESGRSQNTRHNIYENNFADGFNGNMEFYMGRGSYGSFRNKPHTSNSSGVSSSEQKDRRGFALPTQQTYEQFGNARYQDAYDGGGGGNSYAINQGTEQIRKNNTTSNMRGNYRDGYGDRGGFSSSDRGDFANYHQQFPPLSPTGRPRNNRGASNRNSTTFRQNMPNRRY